MDNHYIDPKAKDTLKVITSIARKSLGMDACVLELFNTRKKANEISSAYPIKTKADQVRTSYIYDKSFKAFHYQGKLGNAQKNIDQGSTNNSALDFGSHIGIPISSANGYIHGILYCFNKSPLLVRENLDYKTLKSLADMAGLLLEQEESLWEEIDTNRARIKKALEDDTINIVFQPIYDVKFDKIIGYECLSRFNNTEELSTHDWFEQARECNLDIELEIASFLKAIDYLSSIPLDQYLSINLSPNSICNTKTLSTIKNFDLSRVIIEITEHEKIKDYAEFNRSLLTLRRKGARIAIDDTGAGYASLKHILEIDTDKIKLDISLIRDIHKDQKRRALASALVTFAHEIGAEVFAEGVETEEEMRTLLNMGVTKMQGYYIGRPQPFETITKKAFN